MPIAYIDLQPGLTIETKKHLVREVADAIHDAYRIGDTRVFLREWPADCTSTDGEIARPVRPVCDFVVPPGLPTDGKRRLVQRVSAALAEACGLPREDVALPSRKKISTTWVLSFFSEYPLERAALDDLMAFENPMVIEGMEAAMQAPPHQQHGGSVR
jgi:phenylpyruvate tautomerase PptA (4-oxalocrotonate tautomerase family)